MDAGHGPRSRGPRGRDARTARLGRRPAAAISGYRIRWTSWLLRLPEGAKVPFRALPDGYVVREATEADYRACWNVLEDAFLEWSVRDREPYLDFLAEVPQRPGFEPWNLRVVTDADGAIVAPRSS